MAGSWIKLRTNLWDDPRVTQLCDLLDCGEATVIGGLVRLWSIADEHSENGKLPGLTAKRLDQKTGIAGFSAALEKVDWLTVSDAGIEIPRFHEHNGESAKKRSQNTARQEKSRSRSGNRPRDGPSCTPGIPVSRLERDISATREEETREEESRGSGIYSSLSFKDLKSNRALFLWSRRAVDDPRVPLRDCHVDLLFVFATAERAIDQHRRRKIRNPVAVFVALIQDRKDYINDEYEERATERLRQLRSERKRVDPKPHPDFDRERDEPKHIGALLMETVQ